MAKDDKTIGYEPTTKIGSKGDKPIFSWESPDRVVYSKGVAWYIVVAIITLLLATVLYFQKMLSGMSLVFAAALAFILLSRSKPRIVKCAIYAQGVVIDDRVYKYSDLKSFWITLADIPKVRLQMNGVTAGVLTMPLGKTDPEQVRLYVSRFLPEDDDRGEDFSDTVNRFLRL